MNQSFINRCVGIFSGGRVKKKYCCVRGGERGSLHEKMKKIKGGCVLSTQLDQQKGPNATKNAKNYQTLKNFSSLVSLTQHFTKFIFLEQLTAMPQFNMQNIFFFFFLSSHHDTNPLLHLYHFRKTIIIYWLILTVNHQGSYFPFFIFIQWVKHFCTPANFITI